MITYFAPLLMKWGTSIWKGINRGLAGFSADGEYRQVYVYEAVVVDEALV
jgi:hypothetical protein